MKTARKRWNLKAVQDPKFTVLAYTNKTAKKSKTKLQTAKKTNKQLTSKKTAKKTNKQLTSKKTVQKTSKLLTSKKTVQKTNRKTTSKKRRRVPVSDLKSTNKKSRVVKSSKKLRKSSKKRLGVMPDFDKIHRRMADQDEGIEAYSARMETMMAFLKT